RAEKTDFDRVQELFANYPEMPLLRELLVRRVAAVDRPEAVDLVVAQLGKATAPAEQKPILRNTLEGLKGRRQVAKPAGGDAPGEKAGLFDSRDAELRSLSLSLAVVFGDAPALRRMRDTLASTDADPPSRRAALTVLLDARDKELPPLLHRLVDEK